MEKAHLESKCARIRPSTQQQKQTQPAELAERKLSQTKQFLAPAFTANSFLAPYTDGPDPIAQKEAEMAESDLVF